MDIITKVCRICLMQNDLQSIYEITIEGNTIPEILMACASIQINHDDQLTKGICVNCINKLTECYSFISTCKESNDVLMYTYNEYQKNPPTERIDKDGEEEPLCIVKIENNESEFYKDDVENIVIYVDADNSSELNLENVEHETIVTSEETIDIEENNLCCKECNEEYETLLDLSNHFKIHEHCSTEFCCPMCKLLFTDVTQLTKHLDKHIDDVHKCSVCGKVFKYFRSLRSHMVLHVGKPCSYAVMFKNDDEGQDGDECKIMEIKEIKEKASQHKCDICNKFFASDASLKNHLSIHTQPSLKCELCGKMYHNKYKLAEHIKDHTEVKRFHCEICKKEFKKLVNLKAHKLIHLGVKPHKCPVCDRCFTQQQQLKAHLRTHTKERPFVCEFCSKSFALKGNLVVHRRMHTLDYPYVCDICNNGYPDSSSLKRHKKSHEKLVTTLKLENGQEVQFM